MVYQVLKNYFRRFKVLRKIYHKIRKPQNNDFIVPEVTPFSARRFEEFGDGMRINLLIPSLEKEHVFGGIATAIKFFNSLTSDMDVRKRIIITDVCNKNFRPAAFGDYPVIKHSSNALLDQMITPYCARIGRTIPIAKNDIFIATSWWSAYMILPILKWQAETYKIPMNRLIYLIQDYEPGFYQWSARYAMAESTYRSEFPVIGVFNSGLLKDYFKQLGYRFYREYSFEPVLSGALKSFMESHPGGIVKHKQILIYGRPSTPRNAFELVIAGLREWAKIYPQASEWKVLSAGEQHADLWIGDDCTLKSLGKLTLEEYAQAMSESYIGISLMISPHPSYPPLEMSTYGMKTITNCYGSKDLSGFNENIISLQHYSAMDIADELVRLCDAFDGRSSYGINESYLEGKDIFTSIHEQIKNDLLCKTNG